MTDASDPLGGPRTGRLRLPVLRCRLASGARDLQRARAPVPHPRRSGWLEGDRRSCKRRRRQDLLGLPAGNAGQRLPLVTASSTRPSSPRRDSQKEREGHRYLPRVDAPVLERDHVDALGVAEATNRFLLSVTGLLQPAVIGADYRRYETRTHQLTTEIPRRSPDCLDCSLSTRSLRARGDGAALPVRAPSKEPGRRPSSRARAIPHAFRIPRPQVTSEWLRPCPS